MKKIGFVYGDLNASGSLRQYSQSLVEKLREQENIEPVIIYQQGNPKNAPPGVERIKFPDRTGSRWHRAVTQKDLDIIHLNTSPLVGQLSAALAPCPVVATIHGTLHWVTGISKKVRYSKKTTAIWRLRDRFSKYTLDHVFVVSPHVKRILAECAGFPPAKIQVAYEGIADEFFEVGSTTRPADLPERYLLHVSSPSPRKNIQTLLRAFARLRQSHRDLTLIIAGGGWEKEINPLIESLGLEECVRTPGYVKLDRLIELYDHAECFAFPSYHEAFGLPNVEAMARGTPVVTTSQFGIPEIVDDAAVLVLDPNNDEAIANEIDRILTDHNFRKQLVRQGQSHVEQFRWCYRIEELIEGYRQVLATAD